jgi:hypothetical protein
MAKITGVLKEIYSIKKVSARKLRDGSDIQTPSILNTNLTSTSTAIRRLTNPTIIFSPIPQKEKENSDDEKKTQ